MLALGLFLFLVLDSLDEVKDTERANGKQVNVRLHCVTVENERQRK